MSVSIHLEFGLFILQKKLSGKMAHWTSLSLGKGTRPMSELPNLKSELHPLLWGPG